MSGGGQRLGCCRHLWRAQRNEPRIFFSGGDSLPVRLLKVGTAGGGSGFLDLQRGDCGEERLDDFRGRQKFWRIFEKKKRGFDIRKLRVEVRQKVCNVVLRFKRLGQTSAVSTLRADEDFLPELVPPFSERDRI